MLELQLEDNGRRSDRVDALVNIASTNDERKTCLVKLNCINPIYYCSYT